MSEVAVKTRPKDLFKWFCSFYNKKKKGTIHKFIDKSRKREVVYMEQMGTFMAEYAEWFYMGSSIVILILLIYVLHRIKKTERKNLMMNREIEKRLQQIEKQNRQKETEDRTENEHEKMTGKIRLKEDTDLHQTQVLQGLEKGKQNAESVTVIHDVIEEVFS